MRKHVFLKTLLSSLMVISTISTSAIPAVAETDTEAPAETEVPEETNDNDDDVIVVDDGSEGEDEGDEDLDEDLDLDLDEDEEENAEIGSIAFEGNADEVTVKADAPQGAFPEGTVMDAQTVNDTETLELIQNAVGENAEILAAVDITFTNGGITVQPDEAVKVAFAANNIVYSENLKVVHVHDVEEVTTADVLDGELTETEDGGVAFDAESFSVYAIVEDGETQVFRRTYQFMNGNAPYQFINKAGELVSSQVLKDGEKLEPVPVPYTVGNEFVEWVYGNEDGTYGTDAQPVIFNEAVDLSALTADETVYVVAKYKTVYYVTFHETPVETDPANDIIKTIKVTEGEVVIGDVEAPQPNESHIFHGWQTKDGSKQYHIYDENNNIDKSTSITVTEDTHLYPLFIEAYWLYYVAGQTGSRAKYVPAQFVRTDETLTQLPVSSREGYTFDGWYYGSQDDTTGAITYDEQVTDGTGAVIGGGLTLTAATTLYGHWTANSNSTYSVVFWRQKVDVDKNDKVFAKEKYDYAGETDVRTGVTDSEVSSTDEDKSKSGGDYTGFHYARTLQTSTTIRADGSTVINVYYDRDLMAVNFYYQTAHAPDGAGTAYTYTATDSNDGVLYGLLEDGSYVSVTHDEEDHPTTRVYYVYNGSTEYSGTFYTRSGNNYTPTQYNGNNLPPEGDTTQYYTEWIGILIFGQYYPLTRQTVTVHNYGWSYVGEDGPVAYTGERYIRSTLNNYRMVTYTGLYGQSFSKYKYVWPSGYSWYDGTLYQTFLSGFIRTDNPYNLTDQGTNEGSDSIYHYKQGLNGKYSQIEGESRFTIKTDGGGLSLENKFDGFKVVGYTSGKNGFSSEGPANTAGPGSSAGSSYPIHVYHERNKWTISYQAQEAADGKFKEFYSTGKTVYFESPLKDEDSSINYDYTLAQVGLTEREHYTFEGWYADEALGTPFNFEKSTMPNADLTLYAKFEPIWYQIIVDPNGGELTSNIGSTYMWKQYGDTFDSYNISRTYIEDPNGDYKYVYVDGHDDPDGNVQGARTATYELAEEDYTGKRFRKMTSDDPTYDFVGWYVVKNGEMTDTPYNFKEVIEGPVEIRAKWKLSGRYTVVYNPTVEVNGEQVSGQFSQADANVGYADRSKILIDEAPKPIIPKYYKFNGWEIVSTDGDVIDNNGGNYYQPGDTLEINVATMASNKVIRFRAVYEDAREANDPTQVTFLIFDANGGKIHANNQAAATAKVTELNTAAESSTDDTAKGVWSLNEEFTQVKRADMLINSPTAWPFDGFNFVRDGYQLLGWSNVANAETVKWKLGTVFGADNRPDTGNTVYAVWGNTFKIRHSSDDKMQEVTLIGTNKFDITSYVYPDKGLLYGGYYQNNAAHTGAYDTAAINAGTYWKNETPYTEEPGTDVTAVDGRVYWLKEVPDDYLTPYIQYYYNRRYGSFLTDFFVLTAIDDLRYQKVGFGILKDVPAGYIKDGELKKNITTVLPAIKDKAHKQIVFEAPLGKATVTVDKVAKNYTGGYLVQQNVGAIHHDIKDDGVWYPLDYSLSNTQFNFVPYYVTLDGVEVFGSYVTKVNTGLGYVSDLTNGVTYTKEAHAKTEMNYIK